MKRLLVLLSLLFAVNIFATDLPYDTAANANAYVSHALALARAKATHTPVLLIFGANWCEDCRSLNVVL